MFGVFCSPNEAIVCRIKLSELGPVPEDDSIFFRDDSERNFDDYEYHPLVVPEGNAYQVVTISRSSLVVDTL